MKDIQHITPLLELANRECLILSDDDTAAKDKQKEYTKSKGYGVWKRYSEVSPDTNEITGEDFIKPEGFHKALRKVREQNSNLPELSDTELCGPRGKIYSLRQWLKKSGINQEETEKIIGSIKEEVMDGLKPGHIEGSYFSFLDNLAKLL